MGRPSLQLGTRGKIRTYRVGPKTWRAIANYKDYDGITRPVERVGESAKRAEYNLLQVLRDRARRSSDGEIKPETKVSVAADMWLRAIDDSDKAARTKRGYRDTWNRYLVSAVGGLRIQDVRVSTVNRVITDIRDRVGRGAAAHAKVVLSGVFGLVDRHDALEKNPVREIESLGTKRRKKERMVHARSIGAVLGFFHGSDKAAGGTWSTWWMRSPVWAVGSANSWPWTGPRRLTSMRAPCASMGRSSGFTGKGLFVQDHTKSWGCGPSARVGDGHPEAAACGV